jgi:hypothetical protein
VACNPVHNARSLVAVSMMAPRVRAFVWWQQASDLSLHMVVTSR